MILRLDSVTCGYKDKVVLNRVSAQVNDGEILCILGPNGIGKTTLFKTILGSIDILEGEIYIDDKKISSLSFKQRANLVGYVPQSHSPPFPFSALDVVLMGRTPKLGTFESPRKIDIQVSQESMNTVGILHLENREYTQLSGGERQLVLIARALAQEAKILILDEPTANLDFGNQVLIIELIKRIAKSGLSIIMTTHHPEQVFQTKSKVALILKDKNIIYGECKDVITKENLFNTYGVDVDIIPVELLNGQVIDSCIPTIKI